MKERIKKLAQLGSCYLHLTKIVTEFMDEIILNETIQDKIAEIAEVVEKAAKRKERSINLVTHEVEQLEKELGFKPADKCEHCGYLIGELEATRLDKDKDGKMTQVCPKCGRDTPHTLR